MRSLVLITLILLLGLPALGWRITKELEQEITQKKAIVRKNPQDAQAQFELAVTYAYTNNIIDGLNALKKIPDIDPTFRTRALNLYIEKVTAKPASWRLRYRLAFAYYANGLRQPAIRELENVLKIDPYNVWAYGYIALIYGEQNQVDKAIEYTRKGLKIDNKVAALHLLLAEGYYKKGDSWRGFREGVEAFRLKALGY